MLNMVKFGNSPDDLKKMENTIIKAQEKVLRAYGENSQTTVREWLEATPANSYEDSGYKVSLFVLSGSPPKGYVIADYSSGLVKAFGVRMKPLYTYKAYGNVR
jgi:hypothetical protein